MHFPKPFLAQKYFFLHGFTQGSGADPLFDGARLATRTGSVVVTLNYRLGPLGFLVTDGAGKGGMNGLRDVIVALDWVQRNIREMGGDTPFERSGHIF